MDGLFIKVNDREFGPVQLDELREFVKEGHISRHDLVRTGNQGKWSHAENIPSLSPLFDRREGKGSHYEKQILAFASGKGGVGKSVLAVSAGVALARRGHEVMLVDADLGGADLHICFGILEPKCSFFDFYTFQKESLAEIAIETPVENLSLISGVCGTLGLANPSYGHRQRFIRELQKLPADFIIVDLGAGTSDEVVDLFTLADEPVVITSPEPTSVNEAFGFLKICVMRALIRELKDHAKAIEMIKDLDYEFNKPKMKSLQHLLAEIGKLDPGAVEICQAALRRFRPHLILNMVQRPEDLREAKTIQVAARELLTLSVNILGHIAYDPEVRESVMTATPLLLQETKCRAANQIEMLITSELQKTRSHQPRQRIAMTNEAISNG